MLLLHETHPLFEVQNIGLLVELVFQNAHKPYLIFKAPVQKQHQNAHCLHIQYCYLTIEYYNRHPQTIRKHLKGELDLNIHDVLVPEVVGGLVDNYVPENGLAQACILVLLSGDHCYQKPEQVQADENQQTYLLQEFVEEFPESHQYLDEDEDCSY